MPDRSGKGTSIQHQLLFLTGLLIVITSTVFSAVTYFTRRAALLEGINAKLLLSAHLAAAVTPDGYYDRIEDSSSVSDETFDRIVGRYNQLCLTLDLQYLWSCMKIGGTIVFTTATSPSKDVAKGDHARFFEVHRDPQAFKGVFHPENLRARKPDYSSFHNEWGHGRMVLVPNVDARGRPYCTGASVSVNEVHAALASTLRHTVGISAAVLVGGLMLALVVSRSFSRPVVKLTRVAEAIAQGDLDHPVDAGGSREVRSLATLAVMRDAIREQFAALEREIAERHEAQRRLSEHRDHLEDMVRERTAALERSNHDLEMFASMTSHDLQEPLRTISSFASLLAQRYADQLDDEAREFIGYLVDATQRMRELIRGLLSYSRVDTQDKAFEATDSGSVLAAALANLEAAIEETGARTAHGPLPVVLGDPAQLTQLLQNLIGNAIKFRGDSPPHVHVSAERRDGGWEFAVRDNGIGIAPKYQERVFQVFQRLHARDEYQGSGIGLAHCRRIVERHNGRIWVESEEGKGATFRFTLPAAPERSDTAE